MQWQWPSGTRRASEAARRARARVRGRIARPGFYADQGKGRAQSAQQTHLSEPEGRGAEGARRGLERGTRNERRATREGGALSAPEAHSKQSAPGASLPGRLATLGGT